MHLPQSLEEATSAFGLVGVDVHAQRALITHDDDRIAELLQLRDERGSIEVLSDNDEVRAIPKVG